MKNRLLLFFLLTCAWGIRSQASSLKLHYDRPADFFEETFVLGNGRIGAIVYGGVEEDVISLNDITLWTGEPDTAVFNPDSYTYIPKIRQLLDDGKYGEANRMNRMIQGHYSENYQPLGTLSIQDVRNFSGAGETSYSGYARALDIATATATIDYHRGEGRLHRDYFASAPDSVIVIRLTSENGKFSRRLSYHCQLPHEITAEGNEISIEGYAAYHSLPSYVQRGSQHFWYDSDRGIHFKTLVKVLTDGKVSVRYNDELQLDNCSEALILICNETSFNGAGKNPVTEGREYRESVRSHMDKASEKGYESLLAAHVADYQSLFNRLRLHLGSTDPQIAARPTDSQLLGYTVDAERNPELETLYFQYGRYLLISSSRTEAVPANLQGLWNERMLPSWSSNYTSNINVEENYWPAEIGNLSEMHRSLLSYIQELPRTGKASARAYYGVPEGWNLGQNTDIWAMTCPVGLRGGDPSWACWTMGGAWLSTHLWEHYAFTLDADYLKEVYATLKGAADFCLNWLIEKDGYLMTSPGTSPEAKYYLPGSTSGLATLYGGAADLAMIRECLGNTLSATKILYAMSDETQRLEYARYMERIEKTMDRLAPYKIGAKGNLQEWYEDWEDADPQHRHQSHLFGLYPGHHISPSLTPELAKAASKTLEIKGDKTTGWSTGWRINLYARLCDGEAAYHMFQVLLNYVSPDKYRGKDARRGGGTYPNLLDAHSPFQIDGNFGGSAGVLEMLVQSSLQVSSMQRKQDRPQMESHVTLLPALPSSWAAEGSLEGVCVRGGYELDFAWKDGRLTRLVVRARCDQPASLRLDCGKRHWSVKLAGCGQTKKLL